jgi:hypothetical protein
VLDVPLSIVNRQANAQSWALGISFFWLVIHPCALRRGVNEVNYTTKKARRKQAFSFPLPAAGSKISRPGYGGVQRAPLLADAC